MIPSGGAEAGPRWHLVRPAEPDAPLDLPTLAAGLNREPWAWDEPVLLVVNDHQRPTPTALILSLLDPPLARWRDVRVLVATGTHAPPSRPELEGILGPEILRALPERIHVHRADDTDLVQVGTTLRGTPVAVNPLLLERRTVTAVGAVEPHYFAGYTGGRKSLVPGCASRETVRMNHRLALEEGAAPLRLEGNPVHLDLEEALDLVLAARTRRGVGSASAVTLVHRGERVVRLERGPIPGAVERAAPAAAALWAVPVPAGAPVVVTRVDPPLDRDLYQALKAFEHAKGLVTPDGVLILAAACREGVGPPHFGSLLAFLAGGSVPEGGAAAPLSLHKVVSLRRYLEGGRRLLVASPHLSPALLPPCIPVCRDEEEALRAVLSPGYLPRPPATAILVEDGAAVVPLSPGGSRPGSGCR
jgi:hypothetical protein